MVDYLPKVPWRSLLFFLLSLCFNGFITNIVGDTGDTPMTKMPSTSDVNLPSSSLVSMVTSTTPSGGGSDTDEIDPIELCPSNAKCSILGGDCITCSFNKSCIYGQVFEANCTVKPEIKSCTGEREFTRSYNCRYCYQQDHWLYKCNASVCPVNTPRLRWPARPFYTALCTTKDDVLCLGRRRFYKQQDCNWTSGYKWSTALILSITLGGFGADRFYLGLWREGIGKLFSFGGLGVWTLVDVILIAVGYVGPSDGSLYI